MIIIRHPVSRKESDDGVYCVVGGRLVGTDTHGTTARMQPGHGQAGKMARAAAADFPQQGRFYITGKVSREAVIPR